MGKKMKAHNIAKNPTTGYRRARADMPKYGSYRKEGVHCPKTSVPPAGANVRGTPRSK